MAITGRTNSVETYTPVSTYEDMVVLPIYRDLMRESVAKDSVYIRAKETMQAFFDTSTMTDTEKAAVLSGMLTNMSTNITAKAMDNAVVIARENREGTYNITKLREETKLAQEQTDKVAAENLLIGAQIDKMRAEAANRVFEGWKLQTDMIRDNGLRKDHTLTVDNILITAGAMEDKGTKYSSSRQIDATTHTMMAKSVMESGNVTWAMTNPGTLTLATPATDGLTLAQTRVAKRQVIAFEDNKRQHAANSSAAMMSMLISSGDGGLIAGDPASADPPVASGSPLGLWYDAIVDLTTDDVTVI